MVLERLQQQERKYSELQKRPSFRPSERKFSEVQKGPSFRPSEQTSVRTPTPNPNERIIWLSDPLQKTYEDRQILPGEMYKVTLNSMTSEKQPCLKPPRGFFLSKPGPPGKVRLFLLSLLANKSMNENAIKILMKGCMISPKSHSFTKTLGK